VPPVLSNPVGDKGQEARHGALADLATRQHGVVATRQLEAIGYGRNSVAKAANAGRLHRVHRGVYVVGQRRLTWHGRCMSAVLASAPSVASHWSAAWLWGLLRSRPGTLHVTCRSGRRAKRAFVLHAADLRVADRTLRDEIPVTSVSRTVLDLREMQGLLGRTRGHQGWSTVGAALEAYRPERQFTRSGLERRFLELVREARLPEPTMNAFVAGFEIDAWWAAERLGVELDVFETHGSRLSFEEDRVRDDKLLLAGIRTVRITGVRLEREPGAVVDSLRRHLAHRSPRLAG
jgi:very-short-patch-repair endonuclease